MTQDGPGKVIEMGSGFGSTPYLREYCETFGRNFQSFENHPDWAKKTGSTLIHNWQYIDATGASVLFIDHAPGERRKIDIQRFKDLAVILVVHDTEPAADHGYQMRQHLEKFKYKAELKTQGAWATIVSNFIDVTECIGTTYKNYKVTGYDKNK